MNQNQYSISKNATIETVEISRHKILVINNFLDAPETMTEYASRSQFSPYPGLADRKGYPGIRAIAPPEYSYNITTFLEPIIKREYNIPQQLDIRKSVCAFSLMTVPPESLGPLQRTPHFDSSTPYHIAALLYLCDEQHGGTAFYRHNMTGLESIDAETRENYLDIYYEEINTKRPQPEYFLESSSLYTKIGMVQAKFNRLVLYKGSILHAPYIDPKISIDSRPGTGRLTVNSFFDF